MRTISATLSVLMYRDVEHINLKRPRLLENLYT